MSRAPESLIPELSAIAGERYVLDRAALAGRDPGFHPDNLGAACAVLPEDTEQVARIVALCARHRIGIVPQGGRTGLAGGAIADAACIILDLSRMRAIERLDPLAATALVQCGATLQSVEEAANAQGLSVGIDLGARGTATIGGMISTNAGGMAAFRNGAMRSRVLGLEAVTASGAVLNDLTEVPKCNEGYDLKHLFCGAEGTLGIVTRAVLRLVPHVQPDTTLLIAVENAASALSILRGFQVSADVRPVHAEIMWRSYAHHVASEIGLSRMLAFCEAPAYLLLDIVAAEEAYLTLLADMPLLDALVAKSEGERRDLWRIREESFVVDRTVPGCQWYDISVPLDRIDETVAGIAARLKALDPQIGVWVMGHLGDGNLHYTVSSGALTGLKREAGIKRAVYQGLKQIGGSFSAEHGIGTEKRGSLAAYGDPEKLRLMAGIKRAFDPEGIMNPGKVLPGR